MSFVRRAATLTLALSLAGPALAEGDENHELTYFAVMGGGLFEVDPDRNTPDTDIRDGGGLGYIFGKQTAEGRGWEVPVFIEAFETGSDNGTDFYRYTIGADYVLSVGDRVERTYFALLGVGATYNDVFPDDNDDWGWYGNVGIGFTTAAWNDLGMKLRGEARYTYDGYDNGVTDGFDDFRLSAGIEFALGGPAEVVTETVETIKIVEVERRITEDDDGDGVINSADQCPNTPPDTRVDGTGCELTDVVRLEGVTFEFNKARLRPDAKTILNDAAEVLNRYPDMVVEIAGHTDNVGSDEYNMKLSLERATSVLNYLISIGVDDKRMSAAGYGESEPLVSNDTEAGREHNRRVEMRILN